VGAFAGLGLLSKYSNLFVGASIVLWLSLWRANRLWFRCWQLWAGGAIALLLALPVVLWNAEHEWASFAKQFGRAAPDRLPTLAYLAELMGGCLGLMSPVIAVLAARGLWKTSRAGIGGSDPPSALLVAGMLPFLGYLLLHSLHDRVQANWMAPLYPALAVCAAVTLSGLDRPSEPRRTFGRHGRWAIGIGAALSGLLYWHALNPLVQVAGQKDPTSQARGWRALAGDIERLRAATGACWVATSNYATTGQLAYELKDSVPVVQLTERIRYLHLPAPDAELLKCPALYVELERRANGALLAERFKTVRRLETLTRSHAGVPIAGYAAYLAERFDPASLGR
jgi:hypothetical protein